MDAPLRPDQFDTFRKLIYQRCGICLDTRKVTLMTGRVRKRLRATSIGSVDDYLRLLKTPRGVDEIERLLDAVTTNETSFYRTPSHFEWLTDAFIPAIVEDHIAGRRPARLRMWSAACSVGAEPYTLAFCVAEKSAILSGWDVEIIGTDLSAESLKTARSGRFPARLADGVPCHLRKRFFKEIPGTLPQVELASRWKGCVRFEVHNLMQPSPLQSIDCIFLRNVLIYFDHRSKQRVWDHIVDALAPGGYLVIGPSEGVYDLQNPLEKLSTFLFRKKTET